MNASGLSAFNPVERRMAKLSHDLSGIILPHDTYGKHLNESGKTIDPKLEEKNFFAASEALSDVWSNTIIDKYPVDCQPIKKGSEFVPEEPSAKWLSDHVLQTRYGLQIVKCLDRKCCEEFKTNWNEIFPNRFIPPPAVYKFGPTGKEIVEPSIYFANISNHSLKFAPLNERLITKLKSKESEKSKKGVSRPMPFDSYCPSMESKLDQCICPKCGLSWPCQAAVKRHLKAHDNRKVDEINEDISDTEDDLDSDSESSGDENMSMDEDEAMPIIVDFKKHFQSPFEEMNTDFSVVMEEFFVSQ